MIDYSIYWFSSTFIGESVHLIKYIYIFTLGGQMDSTSTKLIKTLFHKINKVESLEKGYIDEGVHTQELWGEFGAFLYGVIINNLYSLHKGLDLFQFQRNNWGRPPWIFTFSFTSYHIMTSLFLSLKLRYSTSSIINIINIINAILYDIQHTCWYSLLILDYRLFRLSIIIEVFCTV